MMGCKTRMFGLVGAMVLALGLTAAAALAQATNERLCTTTDLTGMMITNDCDGDVVTLTSGTMTLCAEAVFDASGDKHAVVHAMGHGLGVSSSGSQYVFHIDAVSPIELPSSGTEVVAAVASAELIGQGQTTNEVVDVLLHVTVDANGNPTAAVDNMSMRCQG